MRNERKVRGKFGRTVHLHSGQFYCEGCDSTWDMTIWEKEQLLAGRPAVHTCGQCGHKIKLFKKYI